MRRHLPLREGLVKAVRKKVHRNGLNHSLYEGCEPFFRSILLYGVVWVAEVAHGIKSLAAARKIVLSRMKNHSQQNEKSFSVELFFILLRKIIRKKDYEKSSFTLLNIWMR